MMVSVVTVIAHFQGILTQSKLFMFIYLFHLHNSQKAKAKAQGVEGAMFKSEGMVLILCCFPEASEDPFVTMGWSPWL